MLQSGAHQTLDRHIHVLEVLAEDERGLAAVVDRLVLWRSQQVRMCMCMCVCVYVCMCVCVHVYMCACVDVWMCVDLLVSGGLVLCIVSGCRRSPASGARLFASAAVGAGALRGGGGRESVCVYVCVCVRERE